MLTWIKARASKAMPIYQCLSNARYLARTRSALVRKEDIEGIPHQQATACGHFGHWAHHRRGSGFVWDAERFNLELAYRQAPKGAWHVS
jgi:hypothetical protein